MLPSDVSTDTITPSTAVIPVTAVWVSTVAPWRVGGGEHVLDVEIGAQFLCLRRGEHPGFDAHRVLQRHRGLEQLDVVGTCEHEEVPRLMQVDVLARALRKGFKGLKRALAERDVQLVGEVGPNTARGFHRGTAGEISPLDEHHRHSRLCEVERSRCAHDAATDDDDVGALGQSAHDSVKPGSYGSSMMSIWAFCSLPE